MFSVGIIGLPNAGKSTLFKALTKIAVPIANYPFTTIDPHHGIVEVKDEKLKKLKEILKPEKITPPKIDFVDIAGIVKGAHKGEGLGNQFLSNIGETDLLLEIVRDFSISQKENNDKEETSYQVWEKPNPLRDVEIVKDEILKRDERIILNLLEKKEKKPSEEEKILNIFLEEIKKKNWPFYFFKNLPKEERKEFEKLSREIGLISTKPIIYLFNITEKEKKFPEIKPSLSLNVKAEEDLSEMSEQEKKEIGEKSYLDEIISSCYNELDLITFYTIKGGIELRATEIKRDSLITEAAEKIHSDFKEKFILAEVIKFQEFIDCGSWHLAKEKGLVKTKGKEYIVQNEDIIEFKI